MPRYTTKRRRSVQRNVARIKKSVSRDRRRMLHWAARGTHADYDKLRKHAKKVVDRTPSYVDAAHVQDIADKGSRRHLAERVHDSSFLDSLAWLIDQVPGGSWNWIKQAAQGALKPFRGDDINEQDEVYALLLDQAYKDDPKDHMGQWVRVPELGSDYVQVFDSPDQHRYVAVRGTKLHGTWQELGNDLREDAGLAVGHPTNIVGDELQRILDHTRPGTIVDVAGTASAPASSERPLRRTPSCRTGSSRPTSSTPSSAPSRSPGTPSTSSRRTSASGGSSTFWTP